MGAKRNADGGNGPILNKYGAEQDGITSTGSQILKK